MSDTGQQPVELIDQKGPDAMQAVVLPVATVGQSSNEQIPSAESMFAAGANFVILPGDGVCGGPACGIIVGQKSQIDRLKSSPHGVLLRRTTRLPRWCWQPWKSPAKAKIKFRFDR